MGAPVAVAGGGVVAGVAGVTTMAGVAAGVAVVAGRCPLPAWGPLAVAGLLATGKPGGTEGAVAKAVSVAAAVEGLEDLWLIPGRAASKLQGKVGIGSVFRLNFSLCATKRLKIVVNPAAQTTDFVRVERRKVHQGLVDRVVLGVQLGRDPCDGPLHQFAEG